MPLFRSGISKVWNTSCDICPLNKDLNNLCVDLLIIAELIFQYFSHSREKYDNLKQAEITIICHKEKQLFFFPPEAKLHTFVFYLHKAISVFYLAVSLSPDGGC